MIVMAKQNKPAAVKPNRTDDVSIQFFADRETAQALTDYLAALPADQRPKRKGVLITALRNYLKEKGAWPPKK
jgi:hypothetical protein